MGKRVNIGGDRLGSGNKLRVDLHGYERSTHDLSNIMRTSMSVGTLVSLRYRQGYQGTY